MYIWYRGKGGNNRHPLPIFHLNNWGEEGREGSKHITWQRATCNRRLQRDNASNSQFCCVTHSFLHQAESGWSLRDTMTECGESAKFPCRSRRHEVLQKDLWSLLPLINSYLVWYNKLIPLFFSWASQALKKNVCFGHSNIFVNSPNCSEKKKKGLELASWRKKKQCCLIDKVTQRFRPLYVRHYQNSFPSLICRDLTQASYCAAECIRCWSNALLFSVLAEVWVLLRV